MKDHLQKAREALKRLLDRDMRNTCQHDNTHRGGVLWEICDDCGMKWADDRGGKPEWKDPPEWTAAEAALTAVAQLEAMVGEQKPEIWKDVVGFEGVYQISSEGRLKNVKTDYILRSASLMGGGYVKADLFKDGARTQTTIHRLVAEAFLGNTEGMEVNHINGVKTDNRIANLEVVTRSENEQHSRDVLGRLVKPVIATNLETGAETEYASIEAAGRDGFEPSCVYRCVRADHRIHKGHKFRLKNPEQLHVKHFLEAAPVAQQPGYSAGDMTSAAAQGFRDGVTSVAQQPQAEPLTDEQRLGWLAWRVKDLEQKLAQAMKQPQAEAVPDINALLSQVRDLVERTRNNPGVAFDVPDLVRVEGQKFMRGEPSLFDQIPLGDAMAITAAPQQAEAVPPTHVPVPASALRWLFGEEGEFECPPDRYRRGTAPTYWWRSVFREKIAAAKKEAMDAAIAAQGAKT